MTTVVKDHFHEVDADDVAEGDVPVIGIPSATTPGIAEVVDAGNDLEGQRIVNAGDPEDDQDVATKAYVDANAGGDPGPVAVITSPDGHTTVSLSVDGIITVTVSETVVAQWATRGGVAESFDLNPNGQSRLVFTDGGNGFQAWLKLLGSYGNVGDRITSGGDTGTGGMAWAADVIPTLVDVLTASNDAGGLGLIAISDIGMNGAITGAAAVTGGLGDVPGGLNTLAGGSGRDTALTGADRDGSHVPAQFLAKEGSNSSHGAAQIRSFNTFGTTAQILCPDGLYRPIVTRAASAPGGTFVSLIYVDTTATTGGAFAWSGSAYVRIGPALT